MKKICVKNCKKCTKDTLHIALSRNDSAIDKDYWLVKCTQCNSDGFADEHDLKNTILDQRVDVNGEVYLPLSKELSVSYMKQDLFYILSMFSNSNPARGATSKGFMDWRFSFRLPEVNITIKNSIGPVMKMEVNKLDYDRDELQKNFDILMAYIIDACEEREPGFVKTMLVMRSISPEANERIKEISEYFGSIERHTAYGKYGGASTTVTGTQVQGSLFGMIPKAKIPVKGYSWHTGGP